jgi:hypothetical protein
MMLKTTARASFAAVYVGSSVKVLEVRLRLSQQNKLRSLRFEHHCGCR